jgi:hypothetical protein
MRANDFGFGADEKLWRRVSTDSVVGNHVKPNTLRLQMSVSRERYSAGPTPGVPPQVMIMTEATQEPATFCENDAPYDRRMLLGALLGRIAGSQDGDDSNGMTPVSREHVPNSAPRS